MKNTENPLRTRLTTGLATLIAIATFSTPSVLAADQPLTPEQGAARMEAARTEIAITRTNIFLTLEQLDMVRHSADPHAQFRKFAEQLARMEERAKFTRERALAMKSKGDAYFADWEARIGGIQDPERRQEAEASLAQRQKSYDRITKFMQQAGKDFKPLLAALKEIEKLLAGERSLEKLAAAKDLFMRANWRCTDVQRSLMQVELEFELLAADFGGKK